jgi:hypothetical protein
MNVENLLWEEADRLAGQIQEDGSDAMLARIFERVESVNSASDSGDRGEGGASFDAGVCFVPGEGKLSPLKEVKHHLAHALRSPACARRVAELFELLGYEDEAVICWIHAAAMGDVDAQDYVAEFIAAPDFGSLEANEERFSRLALSYS